MATLERIRQRSGLLIVIIGVAMLAFILTDLLGSGNSIFRADANVVGVVDGRRVEIPEFQQKMSELRDRVLQQNPQQAQFITDKQLADGVWNEIIREELMKEQYDELGIRVTSAELTQRLKSNPSIQSAPVFQDQVTGQFSEGLFQQYISNIENNRGTDEQASQAYNQWIEFEQNEKTNALQTKYNTAIQKGLYVPMAISRDMFVRNNTTVNARIAALEYSSVADSTISLSDADYRDYYNENKEQFKAEKAAAIQFVTFNVEASVEDREEIFQELQGYIGDSLPTVTDGDTLETFMTTKDDSAYAATLSDSRRAPDFYTKDNIPAGLDSTILEEAVGAVVGPYEVGNSFAITKVMSKTTLPDSVKARHILLSFAGIENGNQQRTGLQAKELADSLLELFQGDTSTFAEVAKQISDDPGSGAAGGDLGWFDSKTMVRPFSNFCFQNEPGDVGLVISQFGFHIIEILNQGGASDAVELVSIDRQIEPSETTRNDVYNKAGAFASQINNIDEFTTKAEELGYTPRVATGLKAFDENIPGLGTNRDIIKWANGIGVSNEGSKPGDIQLFSSTAPYVVAILTDQNEEGYRDLESVKEEIKPAVVNAVKAKQFEEKIAELKGQGVDLAGMIQQLGMTENTMNVNFQSGVLGSFGSEPEVVGAISTLATGTTSEPVKGNRGVYIAEAVSVNPAQELQDYTSQKAQEEQAARGRVQGAIFNALKESAKIDDRRTKFY